MIDIDLKGRHALVTGGGRGIGRATALRLAEAGCDVAVGGDVGQAAECERIHREAVEGVGAIDILINNAGSIHNDVFLLLEPEDWKTVLDVNLMSVVYLSRLVAQTMWVRKWGRIVNLSSVAASRPTRGQSNYGAAKGAVETLTKCLAVEFAARNIRVNCISLGAIDTEMTAETNRENVIARQLVKRFGTTDEISAWILMLASKYGDYVSGQVFDLDGGWFMT